MGKLGERELPLCSQWYFAPAEQADFSGNVKRSLKHALGAQFGTICFGGAVMVVVHQLRQAARRQRNNGLLGCIAACLISCLAEIIEYLNKMATIMSAITGERFMAAGRSAIELLKVRVGGGLWIGGPLSNEPEGESGGKGCRTKPLDGHGILLLCATKREI